MPSPVSGPRTRAASLPTAAAVWEALAGRRAIRLLTAFAGGTLLATTLPPFDVLPAIAAYALLLGLLVAADRERPRPLERALIAGVFGFAYHLAALWWIGSALLVDAETFGAFLPLAVLGVPLMLAPFHALAGLLVGLVPARVAPRLLALAAALAATEFLRGIVLTGFPWNVPGVQLASSLTLAQSAALVGVEGLAAPAVLIGAAPALLWARHGRWLALPIAALAVAMVGFGAARLATAPPAAADAPRVRVVQPNIAQAFKWDPAERERIWRTLLQLTAEDADYDVVVWPETALPFLYRTPSAEQLALAAALPEGAQLVTGAVEMDPDGAGARATNSVFVIGSDGGVGARYDKARLVPFGEYLPLSGLLSRLGLQALVGGTSDFAAGPGPATLATNAGVVQPLICYEIIFADTPPPDPDGGGARWIANVTNDAWFGNTPGPLQHLRHARLRAIERGVPVVRAANTGISAVIDASGRATAALALGTRGRLDAPLPQARETGFARFGRWPGIGLWLVVAAGAVAMRRLGQTDGKLRLH